MGFVPVNTGLAKKAGGNYNATPYKSAALAVSFIDLDRQYHVGQVLNTYFLFPEVANTNHEFSDFQNGI